MKIEKIGIFHTPKNWQELQNWIERTPADTRALVMTAAGMAWNLASKIQEIEEEAEGGQT